MKNKLFYLVNAMAERACVDRCIAAVPEDALVVSVECDGLVLLPSFGDVSEQWVQSLLEAFNAADGAGTWAVKPYASRDSIKETLQRQNQHVPEDAWHQHDDDWYDVEAMRMQCYKRLWANEIPSVFLARLLPHTIVDGRMLRDVAFSGGGSKDGLDLWLYQRQNRGGFWAQVPESVGRQFLEQRVLDEVAKLLIPLLLPP